MSSSEHDGPARPGEPYHDDVSLIGVEADLYEAIATLEFLGRPVSAAEIASAAHLDERDVRETLGGLAERGVVVMTGGDGEPAYEPARRGWSAAPEQSAGPQR